MKLWQRRGFLPLVVVLIALTIAPPILNQLLFPEVGEIPLAEVGAPYQLVPGSVYDGDTLRVTDGVEEIKIRLCGIDAPERDMPMGLESRDHLRNLVAQGDGTIVVVPIETDRYGRIVAELFVPIKPDLELPVNAQMVADGMAYHYEKYSSQCLRPQMLADVEAEAKAQGLGVWANPEAMKPWEYRQRYPNGATGV